MSANLLDPSVLVSTLPKLLPPSKKSLQGPHDGLAALFHTIMVLLGFRLIAIDDKSPPQQISDGVFPNEWNSHSPNYTFRYRHEQSSLEFILKVSQLGSRTLVNAIADESDKTASLDIPTNDFVSPSFFPCDLSAPDAPPLVHGFISSNRISDLVSRFQLTIVQRLLGGLRKEGYVESTTTEDTTRREPPPEPQPSRPQPVPPPFAPERVDPWATYPPPRNPLEIGRRDLDPIPRNPFAPPPLFGGDDNGDGMFVGPNHPIFGPRSPGGTLRGPWGGDGFLPPMGAPPGARFDPVGPGLGPHPGSPFRPGQGRIPGRGNTGEPDPDELPPPGSRDMFM